VPNLQLEGPEGPAIATTFNEKCNVFLTILFPTRGNTEGNGADTTAMSSERPSLERFVGCKQWDWPALDPSEIERAIFSSSPKKAPGPDGIGFAAIQQAYKANPAPFIALYSALFTKGYHPKCWRDAIGVILPKANKPTYTVPKLYRIIALLNCLSKVLEKLFAIRLGYLANMAGLLDPS